MVQKDAEQESEMRVEVQEMKKEQDSINMMDEFARYARLERKINKMTDKLKSHGERHRIKIKEHKDIHDIYVQQHYKI